MEHQADFFNKLRDDLREACDIFGGEFRGNEGYAEKSDCFVHGDDYQIGIEKEDGIINGYVISGPDDILYGVVNVVKIKYSKDESFSGKEEITLENSHGDNVSLSMSKYSYTGFTVGSTKIFK